MLVQGQQGQTECKFILTETEDYYSDDDAESMFEESQKNTQNPKSKKREPYITPNGLRLKAEDDNSETTNSSQHPATSQSKRKDTKQQSRSDQKAKKTKINESQKNKTSASQKAKSSQSQPATKRNCKKQSQSQKKK